MAKRFEVVNKILTVTDTVSSLIEVSIPSIRTWYIVDQLKYGSVVIYETNATKNIICSYDLSDCVDSLGAAFTVESFITFVTTNLSTETPALVPTVTGWASYIDTAYSSGSPFSVASGVATVLPNNAGTTIDSQKPSDIDMFYDATSRKILGRNGDAMTFMAYWKTTPAAINTELDIWIDLGGAVGNIYLETAYFRGATEKGVLYTLPAAYTAATWEANGGTLYVRATSDMTMYGFTYNFARTHKAV